MFGAINTLFGNVQVTVDKGRVTVSGVRSDVIKRGMKRLFGTDTTSSHLFDMKTHSFSFLEFFLPDVLYVIGELISSKKSLQVHLRTLAQVHRQLLEKTWLSRMEQTAPPRFDRSKLADLTYVPLDFQDEFFQIYEKNVYQFKLNGFLFAGAAGSGKTFTSLALAHCVGADKILVIAPKNAINKVWQSNIQNVFKDPQSYWISDGNKEFTGNEKYIVVHYEYLSKFIALFDSLKYKQLAIILDESHNFNELKSLRTQTLIDLCKRAKAEDVIWLSGTPIKAVSMEAVPLIRCIDPLFTDEAEAKFKAIFRGDANKATAILSNRLGLVSFKVEKSRLKLQAPIFNNISVTFDDSDKFTLEKIKIRMKEFIAERAKYYKSRQVQDNDFYNLCMSMHEKQLSDKADKLAFAEYKDCIKKVILAGGDFTVKDEIMFCNRYELTKIMPGMTPEYRNRFKEVRTIIKYVHLKIQGECLGQIVGRARIECHVEMAKYIDFSSVCESTEKKTVVFSSFVEVIKQAEITAKTKELNPILVYADTNSSLASIITQFADNENINPLIASYASLSTAVPLVMSDTMILIDVPFRDYILQQAVSRIHRLGADTQTYIYTAVLNTGEKPNISTRTVDILKWSQQSVSEITGVKSPFELKDGQDDFKTAVESFNHCLENYSEQITRSPIYLSW